eukprot:12009408-Heterocapsa_arctica.AAC.1
MGNYNLSILRMKKALNCYDYPTVDDNSVFHKFIPDDRSKLASFRKGLRWALMSSTRIWEPELISSLPEFDASDARWIGELHTHQMRVGDKGSCPAALHKVTIDALTGSLFPTVAESSQSAPMAAEKTRRIED